MNKSLTGKQLRQRYITFFKARGHTEIPAAPLVPENDPTTLFTGSGMQPLVPYLLGELHPSGTRLVDSQPSFRTEDIEEVGDNRHTTFFEMLGNWSLGDYFKQDQLRWFFSFLVDEVGLNPEKLYVTVFSGDKKNKLAADEESIEVWKQLFKEKDIDAKFVELVTEENGAAKGLQGGRIFSYEAKKNWWSRAGVPDNMPAGEPGGGDSEVFYEFEDVKHDPSYGNYCHPNCDCGRFLEIGNSVFMEYVKEDDGSYSPLPKKNVDFGGGLERILAASYDEPDVFKTDLFWPVIKKLENLSGRDYEGNELAFRVIADHMKAAVMMISQGLQPGNKQQGYVLRRLIRRSVIKMKRLDINPQTTVKPICDEFIAIYKDCYLGDSSLSYKISTDFGAEVHKFQSTLHKGLQKIKKQPLSQINGAFAFDLFQTHGFPFELTEELVKEKGGSLSKEEFDTEMAKHQDKSRTAAEGMFKGGLADHSDTVIKYHTATHLLHAALRQILGDHVQQKGSNITGQRLRFDFTHTDKLTDQQIQAVETLINQQVTQDLPVSFAIMPYQQAINAGALAFFGEKYPEQVKVYTIGDPDADWFSQELCGGPHVDHTGQIGQLEVFKQKALGAGTRRVYVKLKEKNSKS